ncbi:methyltransferase FkbM domain-containing protein [Pseudoscourfieldia marina]
MRFWCAVASYLLLVSTFYPQLVVSRNLRLADIFQSVVLEKLSQGSGVFLQIGAHTGFENNDPIWKLLEGTLKATEGSHYRWTWFCVEPVPQNVRSLKENLKKHKLPRGGSVIISESAIAHDKKGQSHLTFFSISDSIDPITGFDRLSGKTLPYWVTQIGSFNRQHVFKHSKAWTGNGLSVKRYIRPIRVSVDTIPGILSKHGFNTSDVALLLIDTEGFDCKILVNLNLNEVRPGLIVFEYKWCRDQRKAVHKHLKRFGYIVFQEDGSNDFAILKPAALPSEPVSSRPQLA